MDLVCSPCTCLHSQSQAACFQKILVLAPTPQVRTHSRLPPCPSQAPPTGLLCAPESCGPLPLPVACFSMASLPLCLLCIFLLHRTSQRTNYFCLSLPLFPFVFFSPSIYLYPCFLSPYPSCVLGPSLTSFQTLPYCWTEVTVQRTVAATACASYVLPSLS